MVATADAEGGVLSSILGASKKYYSVFLIQISQ